MFGNRFLIYKQLSRWFYALVNRRPVDVARMTEMKNVYSGKRCFIICNGPSLKAADLDVLKEHGEITFASNKIDKIFPKTAWRPTYYSVSDEGYQFTLKKTMNAIPAQCKFFRSESFINTWNVKGNCIWLNEDGNRDYLENPQFSDDCSQIVYAIATVTYILLQLAVHMGFKEIYIIGCDNSYGLERRKDGSIVNTGQTSYFDGSNEKDQKAVGSSWEMNIAYEYARKWADEHDIVIKNATRGGYLEAFERVNFEDLF